MMIAGSAVQPVVLVRQPVQILPTMLEAAVNYIKSRVDLKKLSVGLMGHSEGGMIAPIVASCNKNVDFIVLLAGPGIPIKELMLQQTADQARLGGATPDDIKWASVMNEQVYTLVNQHQTLSTAQLKPVLDTMLYQSLRKLPIAAFKGKKIEDVVEQNNAMLILWFRYFLAFNPEDYLTKIKCPVLARLMYGEHANLEMKEEKPFVIVNIGLKKV